MPSAYGSTKDFEYPLSLVFRTVRARKVVSRTCFRGKCLQLHCSVPPCRLHESKVKTKNCQGRGHPLHALMTHVLIAQDQESSRLVRRSQTPWWGDNAKHSGLADGETCQDPNVCARGLGAVAPGDALGVRGAAAPQDAEGPGCRSLPGGWQAGRLAGWQAGWLAGRLAGWLAGWLASWLAG